MKRLWLTMVMATFLASAQEVKIDKKTAQTWQVKTQKVAYADRYPFASVVLKTIVPPAGSVSITLPFNATIQSVHVTPYEQVKKGDLLAKVASKEWIGLQQQLIEETISYRHLKGVLRQKKRLCQEGVVPKKVCKRIESQVQTSDAKRKATATMLESFGVPRSRIDEIAQTLKMQPLYDVHATASGVIFQMDAVVGERVDSMRSLFVIKKDLPLWGEVRIDAAKATVLREGESVEIAFANKRIKASIVRMADRINPEDSTRLFYITLPDRFDEPVGSVHHATLYRIDKALKVPKKAVVKVEGGYAVFVKSDEGFEVYGVEPIFEDESFYYLKWQERLLDKEVAITALAALKNTIGQNDE